MIELWRKTSLCYLPLPTSARPPERVDAAVEEEVTDPMLPDPVPPDPAVTAPTRAPVVDTVPWVDCDMA